MSRPPADRALRGMVAELAVMRSEDREGILAELDAAQRARVSALLAEFQGRASTPEAPATATSAAPDAIEGLSDWLAVRIRAAASQTDGLAWPKLEAAGFTMTDAGRAALLEAAGKARLAHPARPAAARHAEQPSSLAGFLNLLRGGR